jgi:enoyl-CoA hydratase/carnithine racemase
MAENSDLRADRAGAVLTLTIDRPERRNAITWEVIAGLREHLARAKSDPTVRVVVLAGAGDRAFCAGADLAGMAPRDPGGSTDEYADHHLARGWLAELFEEMWHLGKPTIARVQGWAMAGGFGLALACDIVVASEQARFGAPELNVGLWPYMVTVPMLRSMPPKKALELMLTSRVVGAVEGERIGFVTRLVSHDRLDAEVASLAAVLASKPPGVMRLGRDDLAFEFMMNALRLNEGFDSVLFQERTSLSLLSIRRELDEAERRGLLFRDHQRIAPTQLGQRFLNDLLEIFLV